MMMTVMPMTTTMRATKHNSRNCNFRNLSLHITSVHNTFNVSYVSLAKYGKFFDIAFELALPFELFRESEHHFIFIINILSF